MANTYTQIQIQVVIIVKRRAKLIDSSWKNSLYAYMTGIIQHYDHKVLIINGIEDHVHLFFVMKPTQSLSELMKQVKQDSSQWVNKQGLTKTKFSWQSGFGAFTYSQWDVRKIIKYVENQEEHHRKKTLEKEYLRMLKDAGVEHEEKYAFD